MREDYEISNSGFIRNRYTHKWMILYLHYRDRAHRVVICVRDGAFYKAIDLMVANVFIGKWPKGYKLVHLDGNPFNN